MWFWQNHMRRPSAVWIRVHFHLAVIDIRLVEADDQNKQGLQLVQEIRSKGLKESTPIIVLTAHPTKQNILKAYQDLDVDQFIEKSPGYRNQLIQALRELFDKKNRINFDLVYDAGSERLLAEIPNNITWHNAHVPEASLLTEEVKDLFGKLFYNSRRLFITELTSGLSGASVIHAHPTEEYGLGIPLVVKVGRRDKVETERWYYEKHVRPYVDAITQVDAVYTRHLGALLYRLAESGSKPLDEFDAYYNSAEPEQIVASLHALFGDACRYWYDHRKRQFANLPQLYYQAFKLDAETLAQRI